MSIYPRKRILHAIAMSALYRLRKNRAQDHRDYEQRIEISPPCWPERALGALTLGNWIKATADVCVHFAISQPADRNGHPAAPLKNWDFTN